MSDDAPEVELVTSDEPPMLAMHEHLVNLRTQFFPSERDGKDRWGRQRAETKVCGTGWDRYVCAAALEESCPGDGNATTRLEPNRNRMCDLDCPACGGGGRTKTFTRCGWQRGQPMWTQAIAEVGGSLRLDRWTSRPPEQRAAPWPAAYVPVVEAYASNWIDHLRKLPMLGTTMQTALPPKRSMSKARTIRERLAGYEGTLMVNGLVKDDLLDDCWDNRDRTIEYLQRSRVDIAVVHQFSYYDMDHSCAHVYNANRAFYQYHLFREAGFPLVVMDLPPYHRPWFQDEYLDFCARSEVAAVSLSMQTFGFRGGLHPMHVRGLRHIHERLAPDVAIMVTGIGTVIGMAQITKLLPGRNLVFCGKEPYGMTIFFQLMPHGTSAPPKMDRSAVFAHNLKYAQTTAEKIRARARRKATAR